MTTPAQAPTLPAPAPAPTPRYAVSIYPGTQHPVPETLADAIRKLEASLGMPVWMLIQDGDENNPFGEINDAVRNGFFDARTSITSQGPVALLVDSPGGDAKAAYQ